jgi:hypothetical protein
MKRILFLMVCISLISAAFAKADVSDKNIPEPRGVEKPEKGNVVSIPKVGDLHHLYKRVA